MSNAVVVAPAGSSKTAFVIDEALATPEGKRTLVTTYTKENARQIIQRITAEAGAVPANVDVMTWYQFLLRDGVKPYQSYVTKIGHTKSINYLTKKPQYIKKSDVGRYFFDLSGNVYSDGVCDLVCLIDEKSNGLVLNRLEAMYENILIDEVQDLVGYDLNLIKLLMESSINVTAVGDPRQHTYATNRSSLKKKYRGVGLMTWVKDLEGEGVCTLDVRTASQRCIEPICGFASALYPEMEPMWSENLSTTGHDGIFTVLKSNVLEYLETHRPVALRYDRRAKTNGVTARNIGAVKGRTFERVMIYPTEPMLRFLKSGDPAVAGNRAKLYVAATRAMFSVAFVVDAPISSSLGCTHWSPE